MILLQGLWLLFSFLPALWNVYPVESVSYSTGAKPIPLGSKENNKKVNLCVLSVSAVKGKWLKTLLGSPFKPPLWGVVVDWQTLPKKEFLQTPYIWCIRLGTAIYGLFHTKDSWLAYHHQLFLTLDVFYSSGNKEPFKINRLREIHRDFKARSAPYIKLF